MKLSAKFKQNCNRGFCADSKRIGIELTMNSHWGLLSHSSSNVVLRMSFLGGFKVWKPHFGGNPILASFVVFSLTSRKTLQGRAPQIYTDRRNYTFNRFQSLQNFTRVKTKRCDIPWQYTTQTSCTCYSWELTFSQEFVRQCYQSDT